MVEKTSATVERTIQNRRRYFEEDESDKAPKIRGVNHSVTLYKCRVLTDDRLCYQPTDGTSQPNERRQVFREAKTLEERCAISETIMSDNPHPQLNRLPEFNCPCNLCTSHRNAECYEVPIC